MLVGRRNASSSRVGQTCAKLPALGLRGSIVFGEGTDRLSVA